MVSPSDGHIVGVHDAVVKADRLPLGDHLGGFKHAVFQHQISICCPPLGPVCGKLTVDHIVGQGFYGFWLVAVVEVLEGAEAYMALGHAADGGAGLYFFAVDLGFCCRAGTGLWWWLCPGRAWLRSTGIRGCWSAARRGHRQIWSRGWGLRTFELDVPQLCRCHATGSSPQCGGAAIAELASPDAELVAGVNQRYGFDIGGASSCRSFVANISGLL